MGNPFRTMRGNRDVDLAHEAINQHRLAVESDGMLCAQIIAGGEFHYRLTFWQAFKGMKYVSPDMAEPLWAYFKFLLERHWGTPPDGTTHEKYAGGILDALEVPSEPTQADIDAAWEVESGSSEEGRRFLYGPDGDPGVLIEQLKEIKH